MCSARRPESASTCSSSGVQHTLFLLILERDPQNFSPSSTLPLSMWHNAGVACTHMCAPSALPPSSGRKPTVRQSSTPAIPHREESGIARKNVEIKAQRCRLATIKAENNRLDSTSRSIRHALPARSLPSLEAHHFVCPACSTAAPSGCPCRWCASAGGGTSPYHA